MIRDYCGKRYGFSSYLTGFLIGAVLGYTVSEIIYEDVRFNLVLALFFGLIGARWFVYSLISNRKKRFTEEFCDYLDCISSSFACGKNTYEAFLTADDDIRDLHRKQADCRRIKKRQTYRGIACRNGDS